jgi:hypothetical protein
MNSECRYAHARSACRIALHAEFSQRTVAGRDSKHLLPCMEDATMPRAKQVTKKNKRGSKTVPVLGAAGLTFSLVGGASAAVAPTTDIPQTRNFSPTHEVTLGDEEISDISLATFHVFDKENLAAKGGVQMARGCRCGGCGRGCRGCGRGCRCGGCGGGCSCCFSWGACRPC